MILKVLSKEKNDAWYKSIDEMHGLSMGDFSHRGDFKEKLKLYEFFNNDLHQYQDEINAICTDVLNQTTAQEELLAYNKIKNKYDVLDGELLRRGNNHKIILLTAKAIRAKNEKFLEEINSNVEKDFQVIFNKAKEELQSLSPEELQQYILEQRQMLTPRDIKYKNYLSDVEIFKNKMLRHIYMTDDILPKKRATFKDEFIISEFYLKNEWRHGKPTITHLNPLYCKYLKSGNEPRVSNSDWFQYTDQITIGDALSEYINSMEFDDLEKFIEQNAGLNVDKTHLTSILHNYSQFYLAQFLSSSSYDNALVGLNETSSYYPNMFSTFVRRQHMEFKAWDEMLFYTSSDEYGDKITVILDNNTNIIPSNASKVDYVNEYHEKSEKYIWADEFGSHEVRLKWIPQRYEMTRLGNNTLVQKRKVPLQPQNSQNPVSSFCLSYKGGVFNNTNSKACSRMEQAIPSQFQILGLKRLYNKEMGKYRGFTLGRDVAQIPHELGQDKGANPQDILSTVDTMGKQTGTEYFDSNSSKNGMRNNQQGSPLIPMQLGDPSIFVILQQAIQALDIEVGLACGVSPSREGQQVQGTNVTDNQQALVQTSLATEKDYYEHSQIWTEALNECLHAWDIYFKKYFEDNPDSNEMLIEHGMPDGTRELIKVIPDFLSFEDTGVYLQDTYSDKEYKDMMRVTLQQNTQEIDIETRSAMTKLIASGASTEEIHREVQMLMGNIYERQKQQQEAERAMLAEKDKFARDLMAYQSQLRVQENLAISSGQEASKIEIEKIKSSVFALQADINANAINDALEIEQLKIQADKEKQQKEHSHEFEVIEAETKQKVTVEKAKPKPTVSKSK